MKKAVITSKAPLIETEVVTAQVGLLDIGGQKSTGGLLSEEELIGQLKSELNQYQRHLQMSVYVALRVGIVLVRMKSTEPRGTVQRIIDDHFEGYSHTTLTNWMRLANDFLVEVKLLEPHRQKLNTTDVQPFLEAQLELFSMDDLSASPKRIRQAVEQARFWVVNRSVNQILRDIMAERIGPNKNLDRKGKKPADKVDKWTLKQRYFEEALQTFDHHFENKDWMATPRERIAEVAALLEARATTMRAHLATL